MLIVKLTPAYLDTSSFLVIVIVFWWLCRLCTTMRTLCDAEPCSCDFVGRITCICQLNGVQEVEVSRDGVNRLIPTASYLHIKDCSTVRIRTKSFETLQNLARVSVVNVRNLTLEEHSFSWNDSAVYETYPHNGISIRVENSTMSTLPTYVFRGRVDYIDFVHARIGTIRAYAFTSLAGTKSIAFHECDVGVVESQAFKKFYVENAFAMVGGRIRTPLPSRTLLDVGVLNELRFSGVRFDRVHSAAVRVHGPRKFQIQNCDFGRVDGEAFVVHTRGPVFIDDNRIGAAATAAFVGIGVERHILESEGHQELIFENNTIGACERAALLFNAGAFAPKLDWLYVDAGCDCGTLRHWLSDVIVFAHRYPVRAGGSGGSSGGLVGSFIAGESSHAVGAPNVRVDEIVYCRQRQDGDEYARLKDFSHAYCGESTSSTRLLTLAGGIAALVVVALAMVYFIWYKNRRGRRTRWQNVPQSSPMHEPMTATTTTTTTMAHSGSSGTDPPSPCYEEPSTSRRHVVLMTNEADDHHYPNRRYLKETELRLMADAKGTERNVVNVTKAITTTTPVEHIYANRIYDRGSNNQHEYSNPYAELTREYKYRFNPANRQQLLTSDL